MTIGRGLLAGVALDALTGDPRRGHPVAAFGRAAGALERRLYADSKVRGAVFAGVCVLGAAGPGSPPPAVARCRVAAATWAVLGGTSLAREGLAMGESLEAGDVEAARARLPHLCGRDPDGLDPKELARATVESIAENTSDAAVAPLLWGAVAGVPGLLGYRAVNTLDAMVGYRAPLRELRLGRRATRRRRQLGAGPAHRAAHRGVRAARRRLAARGVRASCAATAAGTPARTPGAARRRSPGRSGVRLGGVNVYGDAASSTGPSSVTAARRSRPTSAAPSGCPVRSRLAAAVLAAAVGHLP